MSQGEDIIAKILTKSNITFEREKTFHDLKHGTYRFDFYLPSYNGRQVIIEYNGAQHYQYISKFYKNQVEFQRAQGRDMRKISYANANQILLYIIPYWQKPNLHSEKDIFQPSFIARNQYKNFEDWRNYQLYISK